MDEPGIARLRRDFAAACHDLRQPLDALGLMATDLAQRNRDPALQPLAESLQAAARELDRRFEALMHEALMHDAVAPQASPPPPSGAPPAADAAALVARPPLVLRRVELGALFDQLAAAFAARAFDRGLQLHWRAGRRSVMADGLALDRILRNLVDNALRHTVDGGVLVAARPLGRRVRLEVWDSGPGLPAAVVAALAAQAPGARAGLLPSMPAVAGGATGSPPQAGSAAEARLAMAHAAQRAGAGLGLLVARERVHALGAALALQTRPGHGTRWCFELASAH